MTDEKVKMRLSFLSYARTTLRMADKATTTEDWETAIRCWFSDETLAAWKAYEAGYMDGFEIAREEKAFAEFTEEEEKK